jgi:hypothetical protein
MQTRKPVRGDFYNPQSRAAHRQQMWLQVFLPIGIAILAILALAVGVSIGSGDQVTRWSGIAVIFLVIPAALIGFLALALLILGIFLLARLNMGLPRWAYLAQTLLAMLSLRVRSAADHAASPVIAARGFWASVQAFFSYLRN